MLYRITFYDEAEDIVTADNFELYGNDTFVRFCNSIIVDEPDPYGEGMQPRKQAEYIAAYPLNRIKSITHLV